MGILNIGKITSNGTHLSFLLPLSSGLFLCAVAHAGLLDTLSSASNLAEDFEIAEPIEELKCSLSKSVN